MYRILKTVIALFLIASSYNLKSQEFSSFIDSVKNLCSFNSISSNLLEFENLGIKEPGTEALNNTADWIIEKHQLFGYDDIRRDTFVFSGDTLFNIVVTKQGTDYPDTYLIVDGHYDTENGPGANDNGSGTVTVMEVARIMKNIETKYSVKFIYFSAEESGLVGSSYYVENTVVPENMDIRLVFNIDEVGGISGMSNTIITCERDEGAPTTNNAESAAFTDTLANCVELYSNLTASISYAYGSDYMPFEENGEIITGLYEYNESPYPHSINDSISNLDLDYIFEIAKASTAASLFFSKAYEAEDTTELVKRVEKKNFNLYPNPAKNYLNIEPNSKKAISGIGIFNAQGQLIMRRMEGDFVETKIDISQLTAGMYVLQIYSRSGMERYKFIKE